VLPHIQWGGVNGLDEVLVEQDVILLASVLRISTANGSFQVENLGVIVVVV